MRTCFLIISIICTSLSAFCQLTDRYSIIPKPAQLDTRPGEFSISRSTVFLVPADDPTLHTLINDFAAQLQQSTGIRPAIRPFTSQSSEPTTDLIQFISLRDTTMGREGYRIDINPQRVTVEAAGLPGFFYAIQTLYQLLPPLVLNRDTHAGQSSVLRNALPVSLPIPACRIQDQPRYGYRGMHLDVCRHFFSVAFIKKYIDLMALHKFNTFHWHLTDDQGWRIEIKKYPRLTQVGSRRSETLVGHYNEYDPQVFDGKPYGGFYTQDEIREVVRYAQSRFVTIVPEIELPGHALAALASYPELSCSPKNPYRVATKWGVFDDVFCPTEQTFTFLENVLTEVMSLFPGNYIHIGGDECPKAVWRRNAYCQELIKREKLKNENGLQLYIIKRIDRFVSSKGRRIIGWDEILEGNSPSLQLSPDATVMTWRSVANGIRAAKLQHDVIMTPGQFCYLDHLQGDPAQEPLGFGGYLPLEKVYSYDPTPAGLTAQEATHILGTQANVWTEYIPTEAQAEYMVWPRGAALAEVAWSPLAQKNYADFTRRLRTHFQRLDYLNTNYARTLYDALPTARPTADGTLEISLQASIPAAGVPVPVIRYSLDGSTPSANAARYDNPFILTKSATVRTATFAGDNSLDLPTKIEKLFLVSKATGKPYTLLNGSTSEYGLTDGSTADIGGYDVSGVTSFQGDFNAVIDLGKSESVRNVRVGFLKYTARNICLPKQVDVALSEAGKLFSSVQLRMLNPAEGGKRGINRVSLDFAPRQARYIRIIGRNVGKVPAGLRNPGRTASLGIDEIEIH